jgi:hypothetical protein
VGEISEVKADDDGVVQEAGAIQESNGNAQQEECMTGQDLMSASLEKNDIDSWTIVDGAEAMETQLPAHSSQEVKHDFFRTEMNV